MSASRYGPNSTNFGSIYEASPQALLGYERQQPKGLFDIRHCKPETWDVRLANIVTRENVQLDGSRNGNKALRGSSSDGTGTIIA